MAAVLPTYLTLFGGSYFGITSGTASSVVRVNAAGTAFEQVTIYSRSEADASFAAIGSLALYGLLSGGNSWYGTQSFLNSSDATTASINAQTGNASFGGTLLVSNKQTIMAPSSVTGNLFEILWNNVSRMSLEHSNGILTVGGLSCAGNSVLSSIFSPSINTQNTNTRMSVQGANMTTNDGVRMAYGAWSNSSGTPAAVVINPTDSTTGTGGITALKVNLAGTGTGSGAKRLLDLQKVGTSKVFVTSLGSSVFSDAAIATNATDGFIYMPTCAGTPTGTPTTQTGTVAIVYDTSNEKLYVYSGAWKSVTLA